MRCRLSFWVTLLGIVLLLWTGSAATLSGTVTDPSRGVIAGARVTIRDEGSGVTRASTTNSAGVYSFTDLGVGRYAIEFASTGFKTSAVSGIQLDVADARAVDV